MVTYILKKNGDYRECTGWADLGKQYKKEYNQIMMESDYEYVVETGGKYPDIFSINGK